MTSASDFTVPRPQFPHLRNGHHNDTTPTQGNIVRALPCPSCAGRSSSISSRHSISRTLPTPGKGEWLPVRLLAPALSFHVASANSARCCDCPCWADGEAKAPRWSRFAQRLSQIAQNGSALHLHPPSPPPTSQPRTLPRPPGELQNAISKPKHMTQQFPKSVSTPKK